MSMSQIVNAIGRQPDETNMSRNQDGSYDGSYDDWFWRQENVTARIRGGQLDQTFVGWPDCY